MKVGSSALGANGGIYAIRRTLFSPISADTIVDDFVLPLEQTTHRMRIVFDPTAVGARGDIGPHWRVTGGRIAPAGSKRRPTVAAAQSPAHGWVAFTFLSHKFLRWVCPFFLVALLASKSRARIRSDLPHGTGGPGGFYVVSGIRRIRSDESALA